MARKVEAVKKAAKAEKKEVEFRCIAPQANAVRLAGTFNNWDANSLLFKKGRAGTWTVKISLEPGKYEYKFVVDGSWLMDPSCKESVANNLGSSNSVLVVK